MVIGSDIYSPSSQILVSKGAVFNENLRKSLIRYGISRISIEEIIEKPEFTQEELQKAEEECREKVVGRFFNSPTEPMMKIIMETALKIEAKEYLGCKRSLS